MGDLTKRLSRSEFACRCGCGYNTVDHALPYLLEEAADYFEDTIIRAVRVRIHINSGCRCPEYNREIGGSEKSQHMLGRAADFTLSIEKADGRRVPVPADDVADYLEGMYPAEYGIGRYNGWTHVDTRSNGPARWDKR